MPQSKRGHVQPFHVMEVAKAAAAHQRKHGQVIGLHVGQPTSPAPEPARRRAAEAAAGEQLGYTVTNGLPELRQVIAADYQRRGYQVDPGEVVVTTGSSGGFLLAALAAFDPGDRVVMARPGYPAYRNTLQALGVEVIEVSAGPSERYQLSLAMLEGLAEPPAGVVIASPSNPTGTIIDPEELAAISAWCVAHQCRLISDEIYHGISYGRECVSARRYGSEAIVVGSLSKYYSMTGWRVGWLLVPERLAAQIEKLQSNLAICAPAISQVAALEAFSAPARRELDAHVRRYADNRELLLQRLPGLGLDRFAPPDGAFYLYLDVSAFTDDSLTWCADVLAATAVALAPGVDFDPVDGRHTVRLSFCGQTEELTLALDRLAGYLEGRR